MEKIEQLVHNFLSQKSIAVVGVSDKRETGCNLNYKKFKANGYRVYAVNPHISIYDGEPCYPDLNSIPEIPDAVFIMTNPRVTEEIVRQCVHLGIKHVWMHCLMGIKPGLYAGKTSVSQSAVEMCRANGIAVIPGTCPNQFLKPDFMHGMMRRVWKTFGYLKVSGQD
jgi:predicted CoA-binding protein